jgi:hypothetical protein
MLAATVLSVSTMDAANGAATNHDAFGAVARQHSATALKRAEAALTLERRAVRAVAATIRNDDARLSAPN